MCFDSTARRLDGARAAATSARGETQYVESPAHSRHTKAANTAIRHKSNMQNPAQV